MNEELIIKYKEQLDEISKYLKEGNFRACYNLAIDMRRLSCYFDFSDGIFFAEYLENIFDDLRDLKRDYKLDENDIKDIINKNLAFLHTLKESIPQLRNIDKLYELMRDIRVLVTKLQLQYWRKQPPRGFRPFPISEE